MGELEGLGELFFRVHCDLPREGPGSTASTSRALELARESLPPAPRVVDVACGPGAQTLVLLDELPEDATVTALDLYGAFLDQLRVSLEEREGSERVELVEADMQTWSPEGAVDLVWCEGAVYIMGVERALERWSSWLEPGGVIAFSEAVWLTDAPSAAASQMWEEYSAMGDIPSLLALVERCGYDVLGHFVLPQRDWLEEYYAPMQARLDALYEEFDGDEQALEELATHQLEIDVCERHGDEYSYAFVVARRR